MIIGIILSILLIKALNKAYRKSVAHNVGLIGNYLYEVIRVANR